VPLNIGGNLSTSRVSYGPGVIAVGVSGTTPSANVGFIGEDGIECEWNVEMGEVSQGNPKLPFFQFAKAHNFFLRVTSIEWNAMSLAYGTGAGITTVNSNNEKMDFGGDPTPTTLAILLQHRKASAVHTINIRMWTAGPETGTVSTTFGDDPHGFNYAFKAMRSSTDWGGTTLADTSQLVQLDIQLQ
jgi:hypothetical protein